MLRTRAVGRQGSFKDLLPLLWPCSSLPPSHQDKRGHPGSKPADATGLRLTGVSTRVKLPETESDPPPIHPLRDAGSSHHTRAPAALAFRVTPGPFFALDSFPAKAGLRAGCNRIAHTVIIKIGGFLKKMQWFKTH